MAQMANDRTPRSARTWPHSRGLGHCALTARPAPPVADRPPTVTTTHVPATLILYESSTSKPSPCSPPRCSSHFPSRPRAPTALDCSPCWMLPTSRIAVPQATRTTPRVPPELPWVGLILEPYRADHEESHQPAPATAGLTHHRRFPLAEPRHRGQPSPGEASPSNPKIGCPPRCCPPRMLPPTSVAAGSPDLASRRRQCHGLPCLHVGCQPMDRPANCLGLAKCVPSAQYLYYFPFGFSLNQFKLFKASEIIRIQINLIKISNPL
jgi:hypothetical protein